jgi:hypothetical protein
MLPVMRWTLLLGAVALTSCNYRSGPVPDRAEIIRVEHALSTAQCIGKVTDWERIYQYDLEPSRVAPFLSMMDRDVVNFDLSRGTKPGWSTVHLRPPYPPLRYILDDLSMARGSYNLRTGDLTFQFCEAARQ